MKNKNAGIIENFGQIVLKLVGVTENKRISPNNSFSNGYLYGRKTKVSPDNLLNIAILDKIEKKKTKWVRRKQHER